MPFTKQGPHTPLQGVSGIEAGVDGPDRQEAPVCNRIPTGLCAVAGDAFRLGLRGRRALCHVPAGM